MLQFQFDLYLILIPFVIMFVKFFNCSVAVFSFLVILSNCASAQINSSFEDSMVLPINSSITDTVQETVANTLDTLPQINNELSVKLIIVKADLINAGVQLSWKVADEMNVDLYEIERSFDGVNFSKIGSVDFQQGTGVKLYTFLDKINPGSFFYRIKSISKDQKASYSSAISITKENTVQQLYIVNNPVNSFLELKFTATTTQEIQLQLVDNFGKIILSRQLNVLKGDNKFNIDEVSRLSSGVYIVSVMDKKLNRYHAKFIKN